MMYAAVVVVVVLVVFLLATVLAFATLAGTGCMEGRHDWVLGECANCGMERT